MLKLSLATATIIVENEKRSRDFEGNTILHKGRTREKSKTIGNRKVNR